MIDAHVHIDHFPDPYKVACESEKAEITTVAVTVLPSHFDYAYPHLRSMRHVHLAVGLHPLQAAKFDDELPLFSDRLNQTSYVGEIGLDFSGRNSDTKNVQMDALRFIIKSIGASRKFITIHSRQAVPEVLDILTKSVLRSVVFHWYSGPLGLIRDIVDCGSYFSVNLSMLLTERGRKIVSKIPRERLLTETDGPFTKVANGPARPIHIPFTLEQLGVLLGESITSMQNQIDRNWHHLLAYVNGNDDNV